MQKTNLPCLTMAFKKGFRGKSNNRDGILCEMLYAVDGRLKALARKADIEHAERKKYQQLYR